MFTKDVIDEVSEKTGMSKEMTKSAINAFFEVMEEALCKGEKIQVTGFGTFNVENCQERIGRNPRTNEEIRIPASRKVKFRPSVTLKKNINA